MPTRRENELEYAINAVADLDDLDRTVQALEELGRFSDKFSDSLNAATNNQRKQLKLYAKEVSDTLKKLKAAQSSDTISQDKIDKQINALEKIKLKMDKNIESVYNQEQKRIAKNAAEREKLMKKLALEQDRASKKQFESEAKTAEKVAKFRIRQMVAEEKRQESVQRKAFEKQIRHDQTMERIRQGDLFNKAKDQERYADAELRQAKTLFDSELRQINQIAAKRAGLYEGDKAKLAEIDRQRSADIEKLKRKELDKLDQIQAKIDKSNAEVRADLIKDDALRQRSLRSLERTRETQQRRVAALEERLAVNREKWERDIAFTREQAQVRHERREKTRRDREQREALALQKRQFFGGKLGRVGVAGAAAAGLIYSGQEVFDFLRDSGEKALNLVKINSNLEAMDRAFTDLAKGGGHNASELMVRLRRETRGYVADSELFIAANLALNSGVDSLANTLPELVGAIRTVSTALGRDVPSDIDRAIKGIAKMETELLDELGITTRAADAYEEYAKSIGVATSELTTSQRQHAFTIKVIDEFQRKAASLGLIVNTYAEDVGSLGAEWEKFRSELGQGLSVPVSFIISVAKTIVSKGVESLQEEHEQLLRLGLPQAAAQSKEQLQSRQRETAKATAIEITNVLRNADIGRVVAGRVEGGSSAHIRGGLSRGGTANIITERDADLLNNIPKVIGNILTDIENNSEKELNLKLQLIDAENKHIDSIIKRLNEGATQAQEESNRLSFQPLIDFIVEVRDVVTVLRDLSIKPEPIEKKETNLQALVAQFRDIYERAINDAKTLRFDTQLSGLRKFDENTFLGQSREFGRIQGQGGQLQGILEKIAAIDKQEAEKLFKNYETLTNKQNSTLAALTSQLGKGPDVALIINSLRESKLLDKASPLSIAERGGVLQNAIDQAVIFLSENGELIRKANEMGIEAENLNADKMHKAITDLKLILSADLNDILSTLSKPDREQLRVFTERFDTALARFRLDPTAAHEGQLRHSFSNLEAFSKIIKANEANEQTEVKKLIDLFPDLKIDEKLLNGNSDALKVLSENIEQFRIRMEKAIAGEAPDEFDKKDLASRQDLIQATLNLISTQDDLGILFSNLTASFLNSGVFDKINKNFGAGKDLTSGIDKTDLVTLGLQFATPLLDFFKGRDQSDRLQRQFGRAHSLLGNAPVFEDFRRQQLAPIISSIDENIIGKNDIGKILSLLTKATNSGLLDQPLSASIATGASQLNPLPPILKSLIDDIGLQGLSDLTKNLQTVYGPDTPLRDVIEDAFRLSKAFQELTDQTNGLSDAEKQAIRDRFEVERRNVAGITQSRFVSAGADPAERQRVLQDQAAMLNAIRVREQAALRGSRSRGSTTATVLDGIPASEFKEALEQEANNAEVASRMSQAELDVIISANFEGFAADFSSKADQAIKDGLLMINIPIVNISDLIQLDGKAVWDITPEFTFNLPVKQVVSVTDFISFEADSSLDDDIISSITGELNRASFHPHNIDQQFLLVSDFVKFHADSELDNNIIQAISDELGRASLAQYNIPQQFLLVSDFVKFHADSELDNNIIQAITDELGRASLAQYNIPQQFLLVSDFVKFHADSELDNNIIQAISDELGRASLAQYNIPQQFLLVSDFVKFHADSELDNNIIQAITDELGRASLHQHTIDQQYLMVSDFVNFHGDSTLDEDIILAITNELGRASLQQFTIQKQMLSVSDFIGFTAESALDEEIIAAINMEIYQATLSNLYVEKQILGVSNFVSFNADSALDREIVDAITTELGEVDLSGLVTEPANLNVSDFVSFNADSALATDIIQTLQSIIERADFYSGEQTVKTTIDVNALFNIGAGTLHQDMLRLITNTALNLIGEEGLETKPLIPLSSLIDIMDTDNLVLDILTSFMNDLPIQALANVETSVIPLKDLLNVLDVEAVVEGKILEFMNDLPGIALTQVIATDIPLDDLTNLQDFNNVVEGELVDLLFDIPVNAISIRALDAPASLQLTDVIKTIGRIDLIQLIDDDIVYSIGKAIDTTRAHQLDISSKINLNSGNLQSRITKLIDDAFIAGQASVPASPVGTFVSPLEAEFTRDISSPDNPNAQDNPNIFVGQ